MTVTPQGDNGDPMPAAPASFITPDALLSLWQGHRRLTRRVIDAFPDDRLFTFSIGGMRSFGGLAMELQSMALPMARGLATRDWNATSDRQPRPKAELLRIWDDATPQIEAYWKRMPRSLVLGPWCLVLGPGGDRGRRTEGRTTHQGLRTKDAATQK
jgi:hypothetical protein